MSRSSPPAGHTPSESSCETAGGGDTRAQDFVPVAAMEAMLQIRHQQIHQFGHTLEADRARPTLDWARDIENAARAILEDAQFNKPADRLRRRAIKLGALLMAFADKLEGEVQ
ncbi:hypothetical protein [Novosphingobium sp.]|uniref:hypothetical protein n=1 Tax=Novosphingobium sp. TaxID=1874826 RepID=UPI00262A54AA|nr:hypothetical protein [Novosphingobium sp.]